MMDEFYKTLLDSLYDGVYATNRDRIIWYWNRSAERITGYSSSEVIGSCCANTILSHISREGDPLCTSFCPLARCIAEERSVEAEVFLHHKQGHRVPVSARVSPLRDREGNVTGAVQTFSDNSVRIAALTRIDELERFAYLDSLTGVGNRRYSEIVLRGRMDEFRRYRWAFGLLFLDVDNLKGVNDAHGHPAGDEVLITVARTLVGNIRSFDFLGRWGGDEFIAVIAHASEATLRTVANKLRLLVEHSSVPTEAGQLRVTLSIGATLVRADDSIRSLIKRADQLAYQSKTSGRNRVSLDFPPGSGSQPGTPIA